MKHAPIASLTLALAACSVLITGCDSPDMPIDVARPDASTDATVDAPAETDAFDAVDATDDAAAANDADVIMDGAVVSDASDDGNVISTDAAVATLCGNAVLDPGEVCDPGHLVTDDAGVHAAISPVDMHMCPDCTSVVCPTDDSHLGGAVEGQAYCAYWVRPSSPVTNPEVAAIQSRGRLLIWSDAVERDAQFAALRARIWPAVTTSPARGNIDLHRLSCLGVTAWHWHDCFGPVATALPPFADRYPDHDGILALTQTSASLYTTNSTITTYAFVLVDAPNAMP